MIRKIRIQLVIAAIGTLTLVLAVIFGVAGVLSYQNIIQDADNVLAWLEENDGEYPVRELPEEEIPPERTEPVSDRFKMEMPYESRYFYIFFDEEGAIVSVDTDRIDAVDSMDAIAYGNEILGSHKTSGFSGDYRYTVYEVDDETHIIFLDCSREMKAFRNFLVTSSAVSVVGVLAVLSLLLISDRLVRPFARNYERQKQFITDAGHELKTPLTIIDADAEVLEMDIGENEWLKDIQAQTARLTQLTNSLVQLSRLEEEPQIRRIEFPLSDLTEETVEAFRSRARMQNKELTAHIEPMLSMTGDETAIRQLIGILLDNALKHSDENGCIKLTLEKQRHVLCLKVFNTTEHMPKEYLSELFNRFYRMDASRNSQTGGYGLGLSIAEAVVKSHKGKIRAVTQDEKSLEIIVELPES